MGDLVEVRDKLTDNRVRAPARAGALAPCPVDIEPTNTGLGPEKTSFFQALSIPTKISKGTIEIITTVNVIKEGERVDASAATLLNMLNISPFTYGLIVQQVYDSGTVFEPKILDIKPEDLRERFMEGVRNVACVSLSIGYPPWPPLPTLWSTDSRTCWLLPQSLASSSRKPPHSRNSWLIPRISPPPLLLLLQLLPKLQLPLLLPLPQPRRSLKKKMMIWASVFSTKCLTRLRRSSSFCLSNTFKRRLARNILQIFTNSVLFVYLKENQLMLIHIA